MDADLWAAWVRDIENAVAVALAGPLAERRHLRLPVGCVTAAAARDLRQVQEMIAELVDAEGGSTVDTRLLHHMMQVVGPATTTC